MQPSLQLSQQPTVTPHFCPVTRRPHPQNVSLGEELTPGKGFIDEFTDKSAEDLDKGKYFLPNAWTVFLCRANL